MNILHFLETKVAPFGERVGNQRHLKALREGIIMAMPLVLIGSIFVLIVSFPIPAWETLLKNTGLMPVLTKIVRSSFGLIALATSYGVAHKLAVSYNTDGPSAGILSLASFILVTPDLQGDGGLGLPYGMLTGRGLFSAIIVGLLTAQIYSYFIKKDLTIKMPDSVPEVVGKSFAALIPGFVILIFFATVYKTVDLFGLRSFNDLLAFIIGKPLGLIAGTLFGTFVAIFLNSLFWFCGVNGGQVVGSVMNPIWLQYATENNEAFLAKATELPNIITAPFIDLFVFIGGGGATIGLAICLLFFSKSKNFKTLGKLSGIPALFNINTAILFTFPTVLNPIMLFPFILTPVLNALITYFAMAFHLVPYTTGVALPWVTPPVIGGFLATGGSWQGAVLQLILVIVSFLVYFPFFKAADLKNYEEEQKVQNK